MRPSQVRNLIVGLLPALPHLISAVSLPPATRSVNPLIVTRDLSVEAQVCADLDTDISVYLLGIVQITIDVRVCLCIDAVVEYVNGRTDIPADCKDDARQRITNKIKNHSSAVQCHYPANCHPTSLFCSTSDKCACNCKIGYTQNPTTGECQCSEGTYDCHGECKPNTSPCPSAVPRRARSANQLNAKMGSGQHGRNERRGGEKAKKVEHGRKPFCGHGQTVCGVEMRGGTSLRGWECVDTQTDLESCGGCAIPFSSSSIPGTDCSQIPHVADVSCEGGLCRVHRCVKGYVVGRNGSSCVPALASSLGATNSSRRVDRRLLFHPVVEDSK